MIVYLDANIIIYLVEKLPIWGAKASARIAALLANGDEIATSDASRTECLVGPLASGDAAILAGFNAFFAAPTTHMYLLTTAVCERAARIRADYRFKPLDSLHLAAAVENGCGLFLTNDTALVKFPDIAVEILT